MPSSTILVIGSTGNTGKNTVRTLAELLKGKDMRIIGLTRSVSSPAAQALAKLPGVQMEEQDWTTIDAAWIKERNVVKAFVAANNDGAQFTHESALYVALLEAGVKYVVRISTMTRFIAPSRPIYYGRTHWAIEEMLSQPEFKALTFTSLQPNYFTSTFLAGAAGWVNEYRKTGKQTTLNIVSDESAFAAMIDPDDVGAIAARLLALDDASPHAGARYILNGPANVNGADILKAVEKLAGVKVEDVKYRFGDWLQGMGPPTIVRSMEAGLGYLWRGEASLEETPTSKEVLEIAAPRRTIEDTLNALTSE